jgi:hypothetical protein
MFTIRWLSCFAFAVSLSAIGPLCAGGYISSPVTGLMVTDSKEIVKAKEELPLQRPTCRQLPKSGRATASHTQGDGIGYRDGYTSLEFFGASPYLLAGCLVPFIDLRAHLLNDGMPAGNAGAGLRYVKSRVWGINAYYDYRKSHHRQYRQASAGLESLGKVWDFRINGYLPFKAKRTGFYNTQFDHTVGTTLLFSKKYEFDFKGANAEIGVHFKRESYLPLYFALGPYYLTGQGETSWGGSLRLNCELSSYFTLEGSTSYDSLFGWTGQGYLSVNVSFGFKKQKECGSRRFPFARAVQKVDRHEIIPLKTAKVLFVGH